MSTHDYTDDRRGWGWDLTFRPSDREGLTAKAMGHGEGIATGDYLLLGKVGASTTRYRVEAIRYLGDPPDMWAAELRFAPRTPAEKGDQP
jgi:hypothetical protein